jgi:hypothetical protein
MRSRRLATSCFNCVISSLVPPAMLAVALPDMPEVPGAAALLGALAILGLPGPGEALPAMLDVSVLPVPEDAVPEPPERLLALVSLDEDVAAVEDDAASGSLFVFVVVVVVVTDSAGSLGAVADGPCDVCVRFWSQAATADTSAAATAAVNNGRVSISVLLHNGLERSTAPRARRLVFVERSMTNWYGLLRQWPYLAGRLPFSLRRSLVACNETAYTAAA